MQLIVYFDLFVGCGAWGVVLILLGVGLESALKCCTFCLTWTSLGNEMWGYTVERRMKNIAGRRNCYVLKGGKITKY